MKASEKAERDKALVRDRLKPMTWEKLALKYELHPQTCKNIYYEWAKSNKDKSVEDFRGRKPVDIVWEIAQRYEGWIEVQGDIAFDPDAPSAVRVGAINSAASIQTKLTDLLQATGILPKNLGRLRVEADVRHVADVVLRVFEEEDVPLAAREKIVKLLGEASAN